MSLINLPSGFALPPIRDNVRKLMQIKQVHSQNIYQRLGLPAKQVSGAIKGILDGTTQNPHISTLLLIAKALEVPVSLLLEDPGAPQETENVSTIANVLAPKTRIPVIQWEWTKYDSKTLEKMVQESEIIYASVRTSDKAFALQTGAAHEPTFKNGSLIIVDPAAGRKDGDFVLLKASSVAKAFPCLRRLVLEGGYHYFYPLSAGGKVYRLEDVIPLGTVVENIVRF